MLRLKQWFIKFMPDQHDTEQDIQSLLEASQYYDGYVREEAIKRLAQLGDITALPQLLIRANDWVPPVRKAALAAIESLMSSTHATAFIEQLPALYHLRNCGRAAHQAFITKIEHFLLLPEQRTNLLAGLAHHDRLVVRHVARLCFEHQLLAAEQLVPRLLKQTDVALKVMALRRLSQLDATQQATLLPSLLHERFMPVRREAYLYCLRHQPEQRTELLENMTLDPHRAIREVARYWIKEDKQPYVALCVHTLQHSTNTRQKSTAILALGELDALNKVAEIRPYLSDTTPSLRKAALTSLARLKQPLDEALLHALQDESISVMKCANVLISRQGCALPRSQLVQLAEHADSTQRLRICLALIEQLGKWPYLLILLDLLAKFATQPHFANLVTDHLAIWKQRVNSTYSRPDTQQLQSIRHWLNQHHALISDSLRQHLEFDLRCYGESKRQ